MSWVLLIIAGLFEVVWSVSMKLSSGFSQPLWSVVTVVGLIVSFAGLMLATKHLPISIAYPVWTGIGAVGSVIAGAVLFHDHMSSITWFFVVLLIVSIIGIKASSGN